MLRFTTVLLLIYAINSCSARRTQRDQIIFPATDNINPAAFGNEPPTNDFLAESPWPMTHRTPYAQASSPYLGPSSISDFAPRIAKSAPPVSVTLSISSRYKSGKHGVWGYATGEIFIIDNSTWQVASRLRVIPKSTKDERSSLSGAYHLVDKENNFYVPYGLTIGRFADPTESFKVEKKAEFSVPNGKTNEMIVGFNLAFDGHIVFVTNQGRLGYLSRDFKNYSEVFIENHKADISNSISIDENGGVFVLTARAIHKIQITPNTSVTHQWEIPYTSSEQPTDGRLGSGSGTTPSLMGFGKGNDKFVVFANGQNLMNLILVWRDELPSNWKAIGNNHPRIAAIEPITFIPLEKRVNMNLKGLTSVTEQSILIRGYDAVVVSNKYGKPNSVMSKVVQVISDSMGRKLSLGGRVVALSNHKAVSPKGIEKFTWSSADKKLSSTWANDKISCPNGIPSMSEPAGMMYCVGADIDGPSNFFMGTSWTFEGINWLTGKRVFSYKTGSKFTFNSFYAGTEIGLNRALITGIVGGALSSK